MIWCEQYSCFENRLLYLLLFFLGHKEAFVKMKGAQGEMCKWSRAKLRKVRIDIKVTDFLTEAAKVIIQEKKR